MNLDRFFTSLLNVVCEMAPYLLLGFFIAGLLHVFVPRTFYTKYLSQSNRFSVLWAALMGIPLPLCSCGVIPTAIGTWICYYPTSSSTYYRRMRRMVGQPPGKGEYSEQYVCSLSCRRWSSLMACLEICLL